MWKASYFTVAIFAVLVSFRQIFNIFVFGILKMLSIPPFIQLFSFGSSSFSSPSLCDRMNSCTLKRMMVRLALSSGGRMGSKSSFLRAAEHVGWKIFSTSSSERVSTM